MFYTLALLSLTMTVFLVARQSQLGVPPDDPGLQGPAGVQPAPGNKKNFIIEVVKDPYRYCFAGS